MLVYCVVEIVWGLPADALHIGCAHLAVLDIETGFFMVVHPGSRLRVCYMILWPTFLSDLISDDTLYFPSNEHHFLI